MAIVLQTSGAPALVDLAAVKARLKIDGAAEDAFLASLVAGQSALVESYCRRPFGLTRYRVVEHCSMRDYIHLDAPGPVVSIDAVTTEAGALDAASDVEAESCMLFRKVDGRRFAWSCARVVVDFCCGYNLPGATVNPAAGAVPAPVAQACLSLIARAYAASDRDPALRREAIVGVSQMDYDTPGSAAYKGGLPVDVAAMLDDFVYCSW